MVNSLGSSRVALCCCQLNRSASNTEVPSIAMSALTVRVHPSMSVMQLKMQMKALAAAAAVASASSPGGAAAARGAASPSSSSSSLPRIPHASQLSLHMDGIGELSDFVTFGDYGLGDPAPDTQLLAFFVAAPGGGAGEGAQRASTPPPEMAFDFAQVAPESTSTLAVVFANVAAQRQLSVGGGTVTASSTTTTAASAAPVDSASCQRAAAALSRPTSGAISSQHTLSGTNIGVVNSGGGGGGAGHASRPASGRRSEAGSRAGMRQDLVDQDDQASEADAASMSSEAEAEAEAAATAAFAAQQLEQSALLQEQLQHTPATQPDEGDNNDEAARAALTAQQLAAAAAATARAGLVRGDLLDGYRMLSSCRVDLPEEVVRATNLAACKPPLVDAVPEHLAEFTNLEYLDVSGNKSVDIKHKHN